MEQRTRRRNIAAEHETIEDKLISHQVGYLEHGIICEDYAALTLMTIEITKPLL